MLLSHNKFTVVLDWKFKRLFVDIKKHNGMTTVRLKTWKLH